MSSSPLLACNQRSVSKAILCTILSVQIEAAFDTTSSRQNAIKIAVTSQKLVFLMVRNTNFAVWDCFTFIIQLYSQLFYVGIYSAVS